MNKEVKKILNILIKNGYKAYIVGGYVRDYLCGIASTDVDIITDALPVALHKLFGKIGMLNNYGGINIKLKKYNIDITTFRKEEEYIDGKLTKSTYVSSLEEDLIRRDFTVNTICMDINEKIIDLLNGTEDLQSRLLKSVGEVNKKFAEDPSRILRAVRFYTTLNFTIEESILNFAKENNNLLKKVTKDKIRSELNKIMSSKNVNSGLKTLNDLGILEVLDIKYDTITYSSCLLLNYAQISLPTPYFTNKELKEIKIYQELIKYGKIDEQSLYKFGLYYNLTLSECLGVDKKTIIKLYNKMPIKKKEDLKVSGKDIINYLNIKPSDKIKVILADIEKQILNNKLNNNHFALKKYIIKNRDKWV